MLAALVLRKGIPTMGIEDAPVLDILTPLGIAVFAWLFVFIVLWFPLPFAVFGFKGILRKIQETQVRILEAQDVNLEVQKGILAELKRITGQVEDEYEKPHVLEGRESRPPAPPG